MSNAENQDNGKTRFEEKPMPDLKQQVSELTERLQRVSQEKESVERELDSLLYHISHDLRAPLRGIDGYSQALLDEYSQRLDDLGRAYLQYIQESSARLSQILDGLLRLSRIVRAELQITPVALSEIAVEIAQGLQKKEPGRTVEFTIAPGMIAQADENLVRILLHCLLENAMKFTRQNQSAHIEFDVVNEQDERIYLIRDNGVGFEMEYHDQLFQPFQRLHKQQDFEGIGLGLTIAQRIIQRHAGRIWANGAVGKGATFYFTL